MNVAYFSRRWRLNHSFDVLSFVSISRWATCVPVESFTFLSSQVWPKLEYILFLVSQQGIYNLVKICFTKFLEAWPGVRGYGSREGLSFKYCESQLYVRGSYKEIGCIFRIYLWKCSNSEPWVKDFGIWHFY